MRAVCLALFLAVCAGPGFSQTVKVRAGEHDSFTRLVFYLPDRMPFELTRAGSTIELRFERPGLAFDTSVVFQRVPKTRLTAIKTGPDDGPVVLSLACGCEIRTFWHGTAALVLDIEDAPGPAGRTGVGGDAGSAPRDKAENGALNPLLLPQARPSSSAALVARALDGYLVARPERMPGADVLRAGRDRLLKQIGRAASQGLLVPRTAVPEQRHRPGPSRDSGPDTSSPATDDPSPGIQLRAESSIDRDMRAAVMPGLAGLAGQTCLDPALVNVPAWAGDAPFPQQLGPLRAGLMSDLDKPDAAAVTALARLYIHFGFGAEARQVLAQMGSRNKAGKTLAAMAAIIETGHAGRGSVLAGQMDCEPMTALWSVLSYPALPADQPLDTDAVLYGFSALPPPLRAHLGPTLARRFLDAGYRHEGERVRRMLERSDATETPEAALLSADSALSRGETEIAEAALDTIVADNAVPSAEALLRLIDARLRRGGDISYETAQLAGAYAKEYRNRRLGEELDRAYLSALATSGAFDEAFAEFGRIYGKDSVKMTGIRSTLAGILTKRAEDYDFLRHATGRALARPGLLDPETVNGVARRLLSLGFLAEAETLVAAELTGPAERGRKLLRAEIALRNARPRQAEAELLGHDGGEAELLRARARSMAGDHGVARRLFAAAGQAEAAQREAWLGGDWQALAGDGRPALSAMAALELGEGDPPETPAEGVLARNRSMLEQSQKMRATIKTLLAAWPDPDAGP